MTYFSNIVSIVQNAMRDFNIKLSKSIVSSFQINISFVLQSVCSLFDLLNCRFWNIKSGLNCTAAGFKYDPLVF